MFASIFSLMMIYNGCDYISPPAQTFGLFSTQSFTDCPLVTIGMLLVVITASWHHWEAAVKIFIGLFFCFYRFGKWFPYKKSSVPLFYIFSPPYILSQFLSRLSFFFPFQCKSCHLFTLQDLWTLGRKAIHFHREMGITFFSLFFSFSVCFFCLPSWRIHPSPFFSSSFICLDFHLSLLPHLPLPDEVMIWGLWVSLIWI